MIKQLKISKSVKFFERGLSERWDLIEYKDIYKPCLFFGVNDSDDIQAIKNHKGFKLVWFANPHANKFLLYLKDVKDLYIKDNEFISDRSFNLKKANIEIKDYSMFTPTKLGDCVYCYLGNETAKIKKYGYHSALELQKKINFEIIYGLAGHDIKELRDNFYNKSFVNLNLSNGNGMTTAEEMNRMGRMTIINSKYQFPYILKFQNESELIDLINNESKKIGTIQKAFITPNDYWQHEDFWLY